MKKSAWKRMSLACLSASLLFSASANAANISYDTKYNGHCYKLFNDGTTWEQAKAACERQGGHLVSITSAQEQAVVENLLRNKGNKNNYWLGGYRNGNTWTWVTGERFSYTHWSGGQPDNFQGRENRLSMYRNRNPYGYNNLGEWNDSAADGVCNNEPFFGAANFGYICEWDSDPNTNTNNSVDGRLKGDVNGDGKVDKSDADMLDQYIIGLRSSIPCPKNADMNGDGRHTLTDVSRIEAIYKSSSNVNSVDGRMKGDVNGDGKVNKNDAEMLSEYIKGNRSSIPCPKNADANGDGRITVADVTKIVLINPTPVKHDPQGRLESCQPLQNAVRVTGYAYDEDNMSYKVRIHVYIDGTAGNSNVPSREIRANKTTHNGHGFDDTIQIPAQWCGRRTVRLYALNDVGSGTFQEIGSQVVDISGAQPVYREWQGVAVKRVTAYTNSALTGRNGNEYVDVGDRVTVLKEEGNAYFVRYPVRNGTKERWVSKDIFSKPIIDIDTGNGNTSYWNSKVGQQVADINSSSYKSSNPFYPSYTRQCTWYAWGRMKEVTGKGVTFKGRSYAKAWTNNATNCSTCNLKSKCLAIRDYGGGGYGHVVFVEYVDANNVYYTDDNWNKSTNLKVQRKSIAEFKKLYQHFIC